MISATAPHRIKNTPQINFPAGSNADYLQSAKDNWHSLSQMIQNGFSFAAVKNHFVVPVFNAAVAHVMARMDKMAGIGKGGQALNDRPSMSNGGENSILAGIRARAREFRAKSSSSYKLSHT